jgi:hypothetical protein
MSSTALAVIAGLLSVAIGAAWATVRLGSWRLLMLGVLTVGASGCLGIWLYSQRPVRPELPCALPAAVAELGSVCGFRNPEDLEHLRAQRLILISEEGFGGRLLSLRVDDPGAGPRVLWPPPPDQLASMATRAGDLGDADCPFPADPSALWPHGLSALEPPGGPVRVAFVSHRLVDGVLSDSIQLFDFDAADTLSPLRWRGCIRYPDDAIGNDLALLRDDSLVATNFAPRGTPEQIQRSVLRGAVGIDTGDVLRWSREQGWSHLPGTRGSIPNGIALARDESALYYADAGNSRVAIVPLPPGRGEIVRVAVGGAPNNLTVTASGQVLATVATLSGELPFICALGGRTCRSGWAVWEIDPSSASALEVLEEGGRQIATATTALEVDGTLYIGSMADTRIGIYRRR